MDQYTYMTLCNILRGRHLLIDARDITVEEQVAIYLQTLGHNRRNRACQNTFQHSGQTISKYFNKVMKAICRLGKEYIKWPNDDILLKIRGKPRYYPYFKDCLGAIDGTHIPAWVPISTQGRFRNRKGIISQNVFVVVGLDTRFHYVMAGWEGSASDSRVLYSALDDPTDPFIIPRGKYYPVDGGYPNIIGLLTPYRGHRYHMSEFNAPGARTIRTKEELFNHRHSSLRTTVERTFGLLKGRFPILKSQMEFPFDKQVQIVLSTCVIHNFILEHNPNAEQFEVDDGILNDPTPSTTLIGDQETLSQTSQQGNNNELRTFITNQMFRDYEIFHGFVRRTVCKYYG
ncbi:unnamed protein product [Victoria cruziana]